MTRRLSAVPATGPVEDLDQCLLCGAEALTFADLCDHCAGVVQAVADRVATQVLTVLKPATGHVYRAPGCGAQAATGVAPEKGITCPVCEPAPAITGQLELDDDQ